MTDNSRFKFRAFVRGYIVDVVSIDFINQYITWDDNQYDRCVPPNKCYEIASFDEIRLLQWTGLYDKKGLEIFEGDVVAWGSLNPADSDYETEVRIAEVKLNPDIQFDCKNIKFPHVFRYGNFIYTNTEKYLTVVGNIFAHPELAQNQKNNK